MSTLKVGDRVQITGHPKGFDPVKGAPYLGQYGKVFREFRSMFCPFPEIQLDSGEVILCSYSEFTVLNPPTPTPAWTFTCPQCTVTLETDKPSDGVGGIFRFFSFRIDLACMPSAVHYQPVDAGMGLEAAKIEAIKAALTMAHNKSK